MDCNQAQRLIERYLDSELALSDKRVVEDHLGQCRDCSRLLDSLKAMSTAVKKKSTFNAPSGLKRKVRERLKDVTGEDERMTRVLPWLGFSGGVMAFASVMTWAILTFSLNAHDTPLLMEDIVSAHVRSLMVDHATDIASSDRHVVKPWFNGKLDFTPMVRNYSDDGFALQGGRLDYLQRRPVSALVYRRRDHVINVFMWPSYQGAGSAIKTEAYQGYNIVNWSEAGLHYWIISDLNMNELQALAALLRGDNGVHQS